MIKIKISLLKSSSSGNSYLLETKKYKILLDIGLSKNFLTKSLSLRNIKLEDIDFVFISHMHNDHIGGLKYLSTKTKIISGDKVKKEIINKYPGFNFLEKDELKDLDFKFFLLSHDIENYGLLLKVDNHELVYITDTGYINNRYNELLKNKDIYLIEANYEDENLILGNYNPFLKQRVISDSGHLSNKQTSDFIKEVIGKNTKEVLLIHLSEENNSEDLCLKTIKSRIDDPRIKVFKEEMEIVI